MIPCMAKGELEALLKQYGQPILESLATKLDIEASMWEKEADEDDASSDTNRVYTFFGDLDDYDALEVFVDTVGHWLRRDADRDITVLMNTRGGYTQYGMTMYDWIRMMRKIHRAEIEIVVLGWAASMGAIVLQSATHRVMAKEAWILIHEVVYQDTDGYYDSKTSIHEDELMIAKRVQKAGNKIIAARSDLSLAEIEERTHKRDWWIPAREALDLGLCDEVR